MSVCPLGVLDMPGRQLRQQQTYGPHTSLLSREHVAAFCAIIPAMLSLSSFAVTNLQLNWKQSQSGYTESYHLKSLSHNYRHTHTCYDELTCNHCGFELPGKYYCIGQANITADLIAPG